MSAPKNHPHPCKTLGVITEPGESHPFDGSEADWTAFSTACKQRDEALSQVARLREGLDKTERMLTALATSELNIDHDRNRTPTRLAQRDSVWRAIESARALLAETEGVK